MPRKKLALGAFPLPPEKLNFGAPSGAPKYFIVRRFQNGKWIYFNSKGNQISEAAAISEKRKIYTYNATEKKIIEKRKGSPRKVSSPEKGQKVLTEPIMGYSVISKFTFNVEQNRLNFFTFKKNTYQISKESGSLFILMFNEIHGEFFSIFNEIVPSPILVLNYIEFQKNSIFNFDTIDLDSGSASFEGMNLEDFKEEFEEVGNAVKKFRSFISRKIKEYFNL